MSKMAFINILKRNGFREFETRDGDVSMCLGHDPGNQRYAEVQKYPTGWEVWIVGKDIPNTGTISYPGGTRFFDTEPLKKFLKGLPEFIATKK